MSGSVAWSTTPPTTSAPLAADQALRAYTGMWRAMAQAAETSDPTWPSLSTYATGQALSSITRSLATDRGHGVVSRGRPVLAPRITALMPPQAPATARVEDCADSRGWLKYRLDGDLVDTPGGFRRVSAIVKSEQGTWKVTVFLVLGVGTCG